MKKIFLLLLAGVAAWGISSCTKDERSLPTDPSNSGGLNPTNVQRTVVFNMSATWCGPCGSWGIPAFYNAIKIDSTKVFGVKATTSDDLDVPVGGPINNYLNDSGGVPAFAVGVSKFGQGTSQMNSAVNAMLAKSPAEVVAGVAIKKTISGDKLTVNSAVKFFKAASGVYNIAYYVIEDNVANSQAGISGGTYNHKHVLRAECNNNAWGKVLSAASAYTANQTISGSAEYTIPAGQKAADLKVVAVLYKMNGGNPEEYINADMK